MKIGIDLDGVMADWTLAFTRLARQHGYVSVSWGAADQPEWEIIELSKQQTDFLWGTIRQSYNWWMTIPPLVSEREVKLLNWIQRHHEVVYLTNRIPTKGLPLKDQCENWLYSIDIEDGFHVHTVTGKKGPYAAELGIELMLEDKVENLESLSMHGIKAIARAWQYNTDWKSPRSKSVEDFILDYVP